MHLSYGESVFQKNMYVFTAPNPKPTPVKVKRRLGLGLGLGLVEREDKT